MTAGRLVFNFKYPLATVVRNDRAGHDCVLKRPRASSLHGDYTHYGIDEQVWPAACHSNTPVAITVLQLSTGYEAKVQEPSITTRI
jgi:hypothetical protein